MTKNRMILNVLSVLLVLSTTSYEKKVRQKWLRTALVML